MKPLPFFVAALVVLALSGCGENGDNPHGGSQGGEKQAAPYDHKKDSQCLIESWDVEYTGQPGYWERKTSCWNSKEECEKRYGITASTWDVRIEEEKPFGLTGASGTIGTDRKYYQIIMRFDGTTDRREQTDRCRLGYTADELKPIVVPLAYSTQTPVDSGRSQESRHQVRWGCYASCIHLKQEKPRTH